MTEKLKSLAHKDWPYAGTPNEWRGFGEKNIPNACPDFAALQKQISRAIDQKNYTVVYQKQNLGPELK